MPASSCGTFEPARPAARSKLAGDYFHSMPGFVRFSPDGRFVVCGGHGKNIAVFDVAEAALHGELAGHGHVPTAATFLPDGRFISGGEERTIRLWDPDTLKLLATWIVMPPDAKQNWHDEWIGFTPSGQYVGSTSLERLMGWHTGGAVIGREETRRQRVESLFAAGSAAPATQN